jgi:hypothetical protein
MCGPKSPKRAARSGKGLLVRDFAKTKAAVVFIAHSYGGLPFPQDQQRKIERAISKSSEPAEEIEMTLGPESELSPKGG